MQTTSCLVLTGEGNNGIVDAVFFAIFSITTETKNKYKILSNRSGFNENEIESGLAELTYKTRKITSFPFDLKLEQQAIQTQPGKYASTIMSTSTITQQRNNVLIV